MSEADRHGCTTCGTASPSRLWIAGIARVSMSRANCRIWPHTWATCPSLPPTTTSGSRPSWDNRRAVAFINTPAECLPQEVPCDATDPIVAGFGTAGLLDRLSPAAASAEPAHAVQLSRQPQASAAVRGREEGRPRSADHGAPDVRAGHGFLAPSGDAAEQPGQHAERAAGRHPVFLPLRGDPLPRTPGAGPAHPERPAEAYGVARDPTPGAVRGSGDSRRHRPL